MTDSAIPPTKLPVTARAPGKAILFGEHAVVHGRPELLLAIDLYTQLTAEVAESFRLNGDPEALAHHPYFAAAIDRMWSGQPPIDVRTVSRVPRAAGLGSSAAFAASMSAALLAANGGGTRAQLADLAFSIERAAQGVGSPGDTSAAVGGGLLSVNAGSDDPLWSLTDGEHVWEVRRVQDPGWVWLVGYTGVRRSTGYAVRAVGERLKRADGPDLLAEFEGVAVNGIRSVEREERAEVGHWMGENQRLLREVGVSHPRLEALIDAVRPLVHGAKLTGAGVGGSIVALPHVGHEMEAARAISRAGGVPFVVRSAPNGAQLVH